MAREFKGIKLRCPAKVNLHLRVLERRPDGYHEIITLMQCVGLFDELEMELAGQSIELSCNHPGLPLGEENLAYRAARLFQEHTRMWPGVKIHLTKRIPIGAGLGGGSSDAAGVLGAMNRLLGDPLEHKELLELASRLGADVPFFLKGGAALARGIGEKLEPMCLRAPLYYVLWYPGWPVSTAWVYQNLDLGLTSRSKEYTIPQLIDRFEDVIAILHNDLETVTAQHYPWVKEAKTRLREAGAEGVLMSGSGPTVFGLFRGESEAKRALEKIVPRDEELLCLTSGLGPEE
ncbi:MAG: 4-(cytidine 5'-diphospho)-2-C-methyl-D-erythritol kinase [bacterium]